MILFGLIFFAKSFDNKIIDFPFYPIITSHYKRNFIQNYFDMNHIDEKSTHGKNLKNIVLSLKQNQNISYNIDKLEQLFVLKNGHAAFILGIINEFGLFGREIDDKAACRYYEVGSKYGNSECKSSLAYYYRYGIGGLKINKQKAFQLTKESMDKCVFSAIRMAVMYYEDSNIEKAISILLPIATLTINNSTFFDFFFSADHEIKKFEGLSLPSSISQTSTGVVEYLQALSNEGNNNAKLQLLIKALGNRDYAKAIEIASEDYAKLRIAILKAKTKEDLKNIDEQYGPYYTILGLMEKYGFEISTNENSNINSTKDKKRSILKNRPNEIVNKNEKINFTLSSAQLIEKGFNIGDPLAFTELAYFYLTRGNEIGIEVGKSLLMAAVNVSFIPAIHLYGVNLFQGRKPFMKDINLAKHCFLQCYKANKYLPSMLNLALIFHTIENNPEKAFILLNELIENSFLFADAEKALKATVDGNYQLSLQFYKRLADLGSNNASFNVYQLYKRKGDLLFPSETEKIVGKYKNYNELVQNEQNEDNQKESIENIRKKWLVESSPDAYYENGELLLQEGKDIEKAIECFRRGAKNNAYSAFKAGMLLMNINPEESLNYLNKAQNMKPMLKIAVVFMKTRIFIHNIPYLIKNRKYIMKIIFGHSNNPYIEPFDFFMAQITYKILNILMYAVPFMVLYMLVVIRINIVNGDQFNSDQSFKNIKIE